VVFYVDPKLAKDSEQKYANTITLSYTFYPVRQSDEPVAQSGGPDKPGRI
jgi:cytochrome c oxidase assembly protein subunit 11